MEDISLTEKQQRRADILARTAAGSITPGEAAGLLRVTVRQVYTLLKQYQEKGIACAVHGNTNRVPVHRTPPDVEERILELAGLEGRYHDLNTCHLQEILAEVEGIQIGRSTLDRLLKEHGLRQPTRRRPPAKRRRRERSAAEGMLVQIDASPHDWLEGRGPRMALLGAIDDATGKILFLLFRPTEDQVGYLLLFEHIAFAYGLPLAYYHDRHTMLRSPKKPDIEDELAGRQPQSELQRVMDGLGVISIAALSPQAKGRVERLWRTLQDRLRREMRLQGISSLEAANAFLPAFIARFNARFAVAPADPVPAWVTISPDTDRAYYFSLCETRTVYNDHTISWYGKPILVLRDPGEPGLAKHKVTVHTDTTGQLHLYQGKHRLHHRVLAERPARADAPASPSAPISPGPRDPKAAVRRAGWLHGGRVRP